MPVPHRRERSVDGLCRHASDGGGEDVRQLPVAVAVALEDRGPDGVGERSADVLRKNDARPHCMPVAPQRVVQQRQPEPGAQAWLHRLRAKGEPSSLHALWH
jgi:hypothetical protein